MAFSAILRLSPPDIDALNSEPVDFVGQRPGIDHHPVADYRKLAAAHHS